MADTITLEEIAQSDLGQEIIRQRDERQAAEQAQADIKRQAELAEWRAKLAEVAPAYEVLRAEILLALAGLAERVDRLAAMRVQLKALRSFIAKAGGDLDGYPLPLGPGEVRKATDTLRAILSRLGYDL